MPEDQVMIDPEFRPSPPADDQARRLRAAGVAGVVVAAFALGWFLRSPAPTESQPVEEYVASNAASTTGAAETAAASTTTQPTTTTTPSEPAETIGLDVSLAEAIPGFSDIIILEHWTDTGVELLRWQTSSPAPETIAHRGGLTLVDIDVSATWYAVQDENGALSAHRLAGVDPELAWFPSLQAVGVRVASAAWHDTEPGQLAWLTCSRAPGGPGTLFRLDVTDVSAEPIAVRPIDRACAGEEGGVGLAGWGDWGFALSRWGGVDSTWVLLDADGVEIASIGDGSANESRFVAGGPDGTIWYDHPQGSGPSSFLLSLDGRSRNPVPGLNEGEWTEAALWSPDGTRLALAPLASRFDETTIRIVDATTGTTTAEFGEPLWAFWPRAWSSDSRFLVFRRSLCDGCGWAWDEQELAFYDTQTNTTTGISLPAATFGSWDSVSLTSPEPFDFNSQSLCGWFSPEEIDAIVTSTYEEFGVSLDPERKMDRRRDLNLDCFWSEPLVRLEHNEGIEPSGPLVPHPALDEGIRVSILGDGTYGLMNGIEAVLRVDGHPEQLWFGHSTGTFGDDVETINALGLTIANKMLRQMGWIDDN